MDNNSVIELGPRKYGLVAAIEQLPTGLVAELGLQRPKQEYGRLPLKECLAHQEEVARRLGELTAPLWLDPFTQFLVVCGGSVYLSRTPFVEFDQVGFEQAMEYMPTVIAPPDPEASLATVTPLRSV